MSNYSCTTIFPLSRRCIIRKEMLWQYSFSRYSELVYKNQTYKNRKFGKTIIWELLNLKPFGKDWSDSFEVQQLGVVLVPLTCTTNSSIFKRTTTLVTLLITLADTFHIHICITVSQSSNSSNVVRHHVGILQ